MTIQVALVRGRLRQACQRGSLTFIRYDWKVRVNGDEVAIAKQLSKNCEDFPNEW